MFNFLHGGSPSCRSFARELESLSPDALPSVPSADPPSFLSSEARAHAQSCPACSLALSDRIAVSALLHPVAAFAPQPGPWFSARVMSAIAARQNEADQRDVVWRNVRSLAPRLVAACMLILVVIGGWAYQSHRDTLARAQATHPYDTIFEQGTDGAYSDDVLASASPAGSVR